MNLDNIKQHLISQGVTVWPDMQAPVEILDGEARACGTRSIASDMTEQEVAECICAEGTHVAFRGIYDVPVKDLEGNTLDTVQHIRYAAWS